MAAQGSRAGDYCTTLNGKIELKLFISLRPKTWIPIEIEAILWNTLTNVGSWIANQFWKYFF